MKKISFQMFSAVLILFSLASTCPATDMAIMTGSSKGTYYQFGLNLKTLAQKEGIDLDVVNSNGSVENIYAVFKRPRTQLGIVQSDVLAFVAKVQTDETLKKIARKIKMVFPLYNEEIHLVGKADIRSFEELSQKRVAIGEEGSGTYLTTKLLFKITGVSPGESVEIGTEQALAQLKDGSIDAMFYVAGKPVKLFKENISREDNLKIIPITSQKATDFYPQAEIPAGTYPWQDETVETIAVKAVLVSYNFRNYYCQHVGTIARLIADNMDWLMENGHPKWKFVDLYYPLKGWEQYDCVRRSLQKKPQKRTVQQPRKKEENPVLDAIKNTL